MSFIVYLWTGIELIQWRQTITIVVILMLAHFELKSNFLLVVPYTATAINHRQRMAGNVMNFNESKSTRGKGIIRIR